MRMGLKVGGGMEREMKKTGERTRSSWIMF